MDKPFMSYTADTKIVRIPADVKAQLDKAKPAGIEMWKFTADVITVGLTVLAEMKDHKELEKITQYQVTSLLTDPLKDLLAKKAKMK